MVIDQACVALHQRKADNWARDKSSVCCCNRLRFKTVAPHNSKSKLFIFFLNLTFTFVLKLHFWLKIFQLITQHEAGIVYAMVTVVTNIYLFVFSV